MARIIKTAEEFEIALQRLHKLLDRAPETGSKEGDEIELLTLLLSNYEERTIEPFDDVSPVEAIRFRMEQLDLRQQDLVPYLGAASRVSEILSGKRSLTVPMIRALHEGLGIPLKALLGAAEDETPEPPGELDFSQFPVREMKRRGWITSDADLPGFLAPVIAQPGTAHRAVLFRRSTHLRAHGNTDQFALMAWTARVIHKALARTAGGGAEDSSKLDESVLADIARFSVLESGPRVAVEYLEKLGIVVVIEPHLPRTYVDGATIPTERGSVIGMTLRHDRLDNFWFTLFHELAHVMLHSSENTAFFDDMDSPAEDPREREADAAAGKALVPDQEWKKSPASRLRSAQAAQHLARSLRIHPAIVAGKIRRQFNDFRVLSHLVGRGDVRKLFEDFVQ